jgi:hypothetical protein
MVTAAKIQAIFIKVKTDVSSFLDPASSVFESVFNKSQKKHGCYHFTRSPVFS